MVAFAQSKGLQSLTTLNLTYNKLDPQGLQILQDSPRLQAMKAVKTDLLVGDD